MSFLFRLFRKYVAHRGTEAQIVSAVASYATIMDGVVEAIDNFNDGINVFENLQLVMDNLNSMANQIYAEIISSKEVQLEDYGT